MNEKLKFAWGIVISILAIIIVSYISFVGFTYLTNGDFTFAAIGMVLTDLFYLLFFLGAQNMKASGEKMNKKIIWERIFIFGSPVIFIAGMISMSHFWTVKSQNDEIVETFTSSINNAKQLFSDYESYSNDRISKYEKGLNLIIANKGKDSQTYKNAGFEDEKVYIQKDNMIETLRLHLLSTNYDSLKNVALKWIESASEGATTWNVFLLGNTREIKAALNNWEDQLKSFSAIELSNENLVNKDLTHFSSNGVQKAIQGIDSLTSSFTTQKFPTLSAIFFGIIIYLMLLFPYVLQDRHTKNVYRLIGDENSNLRSPKSKPRKRKISEDREDDYIDLNLNLKEDSDYPTF